MALECVPNISRLSPTVHLPRVQRQYIWLRGHGLEDLYLLSPATRQDSIDHLTTILNIGAVTVCLIRR